MLRVRAAIDIEDYPNHKPSPFIEALVRNVLDHGETLIFNDRTALAEIDEAPVGREDFDNCLVAPVMLLKNFDGVLIVADKLTGPFDEQDVETLVGIGDQAAVAVENALLERELERAYLATISTLADAVEAKDSYTHGHCEMVSRYARLIADRLSLPAQERSVVCYAALLHDVGKIGISDGVLNKPGTLTPEERELVRSHVRVGHDLLKHVPALEMVAKAVLYHHERFDGGGYPEGLTGDQIPIAARIVSVVDAYSAMITKRSYKEAYEEAYAREELRRCAGTQFDPQVVDAFLGLLDGAEAQDADDDFDAECGLLPGLIKLRRSGEHAENCLTV